jgi:hypothetical protein
LTASGADVDGQDEDPQIGHRWRDAVARRLRAVWHHPEPSTWLQRLLLLVAAGLIVGIILKISDSDSEAPVDPARIGEQERFGTASGSLDPSLATCGTLAAPPNAITSSDELVRLDMDMAGRRIRQPPEDHESRDYTSVVRMKPYEVAQFSVLVQNSDGDGAREQPTFAYCELSGDGSGRHRFGDRRGGQRVRSWQLQID